MIATKKMKKEAATMRRMRRHRKTSKGVYGSREGPWEYGGGGGREKKGSDEGTS